MRKRRFGYGGFRGEWRVSVVQDNGATTSPAEGIVVAGHSHAICFGVLPSPDDGARLITVLDSPRVYGVQAPFPQHDNDAFIDLIVGLADGRPVILLWSGWSDLLFVADPPFDFVSSEFPALPMQTGATIVPEAMVRTHRSWLHYPGMMKHYLRMLMDKGVTDLTLLCQAPPKSSNAMIRERLFTEGVLLQRVHAAGYDEATVPITPPFVRLKLWGMINQMNRDAALEVGVAYIPVPGEAQDEHGFLKPEYWNIDITHGNEAYGRLYLDHVLRQRAASGAREAA